MCEKETDLNVVVTVYRALLVIFRSPVNYRYLN